jgi:ABC-type molybdate transport system substrate-binding protein
MAVIVFVLAGASAARAQEELSVTIVGRGDDGFKELIAQFEKKTGRKVALRFPNFIESRDTIVKGEPFDVGIVEFPHDADVIASGNVVPGSATLIANGWMAVAVKKVRAETGYFHPLGGEAHAAQRDIHRLPRP